jgi:hypothetical protein
MEGQQQSQSLINNILRGKRNENPKSFDKLIAYINKKTNYRYQEDALDAVKAFRSDAAYNDYFKDDVLYDIVVKIIIKNKEFNDSFMLARKLHTLICYVPDDIEEKILYFNFLDLFLDNDNSFNDDFCNLYTLLEDKKIVFSLYQYLFSDSFESQNIKYIIDYATVAKQHYADESQLHSSILELAKKIQPFGNGRRVILKKFLKKLSIKLKETMVYMINLMKKI